MSTLNGWVLSVVCCRHLCLLLILCDTSSRQVDCTKLNSSHFGENMCPPNHILSRYLHAAELAAVRRKNKPK